jgi:hypothetical protein
MTRQMSLIHAEPVQYGNQISSECHTEWLLHGYRIDPKEDRK